MTTGRVVSDLAQLPRVADGWTFLYTEKVRIERSDHALELRDKSGRVPVPVAALSVLMLGPGSTITHAAVLAAAESGCSIVWCGEHAARFYAAGVGETRQARHLEAQATAWASKQGHLEVVRRLYTMRFQEGLPAGLTLEQIRGHEGVRVRETYATLSAETGVAWSGRAYRRGDWSAADPVNRALSAANACLYGVCHAAIVATGFAPGLGFVHVGKQLSFVYDVADLYKVDVTIPAAFQTVRAGTSNLETRVRKHCRDLFHSSRLLERIVPDLQRVVGLAPERARLVVHRGEEGEPPVEEGLGEAPGELWNDDGTRTGGGRSFAPSGRRSDAYDGDLEPPDEPPPGDGETPF
ncbi:MAG: type I-E CRISPR-associated endonuclease Cas1 [Deltaproteobacteria bacterium]|nr:type I-E CRISPR-associated endonuclease Cas1 [Deltaproteobacteria bacterium]